MGRDRSQRSEVRSQKSEVRGQRSEVRGQRSEVGGQRSEVRGQRSEVGVRRSEGGGRTGRTGWTSGAAPTELGSLWMPILQRCCTYGAWDFGSAAFTQPPRLCVLCVSPSAIALATADALRIRLSDWKTCLPVQSADV